MTDHLFQAIHTATGITKAEIQSSSRKAGYVCARRIITYYLRQQGFTSRYIGKVINRDHASVSHLALSNDGEYRYNKGYREMFDAVSKLLLR